MKIFIFISTLLLAPLLSSSLMGQAWLSPMDPRPEGRLMLRYWDILEDSNLQKGFEMFNLYSVWSQRTTQLIQVKEVGRDFFIHVSSFKIDDSLPGGHSHLRVNEIKMDKMSKKIPKEIVQLLMATSLEELMHTSYSPLKIDYPDDGEYFVLGAFMLGRGFLVGDWRRMPDSRLEWIVKCEEALTNYVKADSPEKENICLEQLKEILDQVNERWVRKIDQSYPLPEILYGDLETAPEDAVK